MADFASLTDGQIVWSNIHEQVLEKEAWLFS
jgi:hypothetical protein